MDLNKIRAIAESYSPQEMFAALVWQKQFNNFDGKQIIADLSDREDLWYSFSFGKGVYAPPDNGEMSFAHVANILLAMANYRPMPTNSYFKFDPYPGDTLYVLTENQETLATQLMDLGKKWQADSVEVIDRYNKEYGSFPDSTSLDIKTTIIVNESDYQVAIASANKLSREYRIAIEA